jgi:hypothetical protein
MPKAYDSWKVLPHQPIEKLEDNLWRVQGSLEGMDLRRVMTIARLADGRLVIHGAMALEEAAMKEIEAWGRPAFLLVPNGFHRLDAPVFKKRYPDLTVLCPRGSREKVAEVVAVDGSYDDFASLAGDASVKLAHLDGMGELEGYVEVRSGDATSVVVNDAIFNMPHGKGFTGFVFRYVTASTGGPKVSRIASLFLVKDRTRFRAQLEALAAIPGLRRVIVSHHRVIDEDPAGTLRRVAATL